MTRLAIAIVHFHSEALLAECVSRLCTSTFNDFQAVVVDNGSSRNLGIDPADPRFSVIRPAQNLGYAAGINLAVEHLPSHTPWVLLLNPDVLIEPSTLEIMLEIMESQPAVGAATCKLELPDGRIDPACRRSEPTVVSALAKQLGLSRLFPRSRVLGRYNLTFLDARKEHLIDAASGAFLLIRRQALEDVGHRLDERFFLYGEDLDLCRRLRAVGYRILYSPLASAAHVKGSGRIRLASATVHFYRAMWTYYRKWGRWRSCPMVLAPMLAALVKLGSFELLRNAVRRRLTQQGQ